MFNAPHASRFCHRSLLGYVRTSHNTFVSQERSQMAHILLLVVIPVLDITLRCGLNGCKSLMIGLR